MAAHAVIVHQLPGRVRLRLNQQRGDSAYFSALSENLAGLDSVEQVKVNASTGSVVIEFSDTTEHLIQQLQQHDLSVEKQDKKNSLPSRPVPEKGGVAGDTAPFHLVSNRDINAMFMVGTLFAAISVVQAFRGKILVPSLAALWCAIEAFNRSKVLPAAANGAQERNAEHDVVPGNIGILH